MPGTGQISRGKAASGIPLADASAYEVLVAPLSIIVGAASFLLHRISGVDIDGLSSFVGEEDAVGNIRPDSHGICVVRRSRPGWRWLSNGSGWFGHSKRDGDDDVYLRYALRLEITTCFINWTFDLR